MIHQGLRELDNQPDVILGSINAQIQRRQGNVFEDAAEFLNSQVRIAAVDPLASIFPVVSLIILAPIALALAPIALEFAEKQGKKLAPVALEFVEKVAKKQGII